MRLCKCGCGGEVKIKSHHKYNGIPDFIHGHNGKGEKITIEHRQNISKARRSKPSASWVKEVALPLCGCGCGQEVVVKTWHKRRGLPSFVKNHHSKGRARSEDVRFKISNSLTGKRLSDEHRQKLSNSLRGRIFSITHKHNLSGAANPNWRGGLSFEEYGVEFNERLKRFIKERDGHSCQKCGATKNCGAILDVHHIDYDKKNNCSTNLIALCKSCHARTSNSNKREYWTKYFSEIIVSRLAVEECA